MSKYCRAYHLRDLRQFSDWSEASEVELSDNDIVYLWDDFTVVKSPVIPHKDIIFATVTPEWQDFCSMMLKFEIPEDVLLAYEQAGPLADRASAEQSPTSV